MKAKTKRNRHDEHRVVGYLRVSTDEQALGPEAQRASLERWCRERGAVLVAVFEDRGVSGGAALERRKGLLAALDALDDLGAGVLLVAKRDRLARDVILAAMTERLVERKGAKVVAADGTGNGDGPEAQLMRHMVDAFGEYERALIRARTQAAMNVKQARGERASRWLPFGSSLAADGVHLEPNAEEQEVIGLVKQLRADGLSIRAIADRLNAEGRQARGAKWHKTSVSRVLDRAA
ncbi:MAG: recombinase family protein [Proteobacteria bacterium]|jgi:DNA invertase Pin-like site-specific DNA recombinase|nr:recombinase family protein [Pseudomonadota bacterium]